MKNKKLLKRILIILFFTLLFCVIKNGKVNAASASITCPSSATKGSAINIVVSGSAAQWNLSLKVNGATVASNSELDSVTNKTISFKGAYTPSSTGTVTVSLEGSITDADGTTTRSFSPKTISVSEGGATSNNDNSGNTANNSPSSNANLSNLGITPNDFSGFRAANTSYSVNVPNDVTQITVYANKGDSGQTITGTGAKTLKEGTNRFDVTVTAADGVTKKTYSVSVIRATLESEDVPNVPENEEKEEETEEEVTGFVLEGLEVEGYELSPEFDKSITGYTVKVDKKFESLDEIKELVKYVFTDENYIVEVTTEAELKEDENLVTIIIRDDEKEYARYVITFIYEGIQESEPIKAPEKVVEDKDDTFELFGYEFDKDMIPVFVMLGCTLAAIALAILLAINLFIKSRKLKKYEKEDEVDEEEYDNINYIGLEDPYRYNYQEDEDAEKVDEPVEEKVDEVQEPEKVERQSRRVGARGKKGKRTGRHF